MTDNDIRINPEEINPNTGVKWREPTVAENVQFALTDAPRGGESDQSKAQKADLLGRVYADLMEKAQRGVDKNMSDEDARAEACYFSAAMTGVEDVYGNIWKKNGFKTGREYLAYMHDFFKRSPEENKTQKLREFEAMDDAGREAAAMEAQKTTDFLKHIGGEAVVRAMDFFNRSGNDAGLTRAEESEAPEDVRNASTMLAARGHLNEEYTDEEYATATKTVRDWREAQYRKRVTAAYHADLMAENAWLELSSILPRLSEDGRECTKALMESPDNRLPETMYAKFNNLPDEEKQMLIRARNVLKPKVDGGFWNTIGDMGIGAANIASSVVTAPYRFGNKLGMMGNEDLFDVNELAKRRQYLWQATGRFFAGGSEGGYLPQMQFEQICEDHGFVAEALIGAVTTLPYMAAAAVPGVGPALVALEAMNEFDDHVAMNGGDITDTDYIFSSAIFGAMYAYTERLQVEGLLGGVSDLKLRQAMLKGFWSGMKDVEAPRQMLVGTVSESLQEGLQNGIQAVNEALALKQDTVRAFGEGFTEDFIGSLGTMFVVKAGTITGGHLKRSGLHNPFTAEGRMAMRQERSTDLESEYKKYLCQQRMVDYEGQSQELKTALQSMEESRLFQIWKDGGKDALIKAGIDAVRAEEFDYYYKSERASIEAEEETGEAAPMDARSEAAERSMYAYVASEAKKAFAAMGDADENLAAFDLAMQNLDWVRSAWAQGRGIFRQDGDKTLDPGAKALEKLGFTPDVAARLSRQFHYERAAAYSPAALVGIKSRYEERMKDKVTAVAALAEMFGGRKVRIEDADYIQFDGKDGSKSLVRIDESPAAGIDFTNADEGIAVDVERATDGKVTKADWMAATEDERRKIWSDYGLVHEGSFGANRAPILVTVSADPSAKVDQSQAAKLIGTISIDATTDPNRISDTSSGFHEVFHAFSYFAQASGLWTDEDIAYLEKTFGKAKHSQERFDEEAAAEAFRSFLARRAAGAMTADDERSPFVRIYAAAAGIDQRSAEKAVQEKMANESENAFFHQLIAEANKPKPTPPAPKPTLSKSDAPQKGIAPAKENAEPVKQNGTEAKENAEPVKQNGTEVKQNAEPVNADAPKTWIAYTPTGNIKVSGHWAVLDLKDVIHSNNPLYAVHMRAQLRNRKDNKAEEDTRKDIVNNFQGERLLEAPDTANGAPIVFYDRDEQGVLRPFVLSGNGRVLVLNELADRHLYDHYRNVMKKWAAENGIIVPSGQTPILVRVIDDYGGASRDKVADLSNTNSIQQYTEEEQARADAEVIKSLNIARLYVANVDGSADMTPGVNDEFFSEFIRGVGDTSLYNSDRSLTQTARDRAQRALLAIAVGQGDRGRDVVKKLVEQTETLNIQRQKNAAAIIAAQVAALETNAAYAIGPDVSRAMADFMDYAEKKKAGKVGNFAEYYAQMDLIDAPSPVARAILQLFGSDKSAATIAEYVKAYCKAASMEDPSGGLFGAARTREEIWNDAAKFVDEELKKAGQTKAEPAPKAVDAKPAPEKEEPKAKPSGLPKGDVSITPEPEAPKPKLATTGYTITTAKGETITAQLPPGGHTGLRGPYDAYGDVPESPNPIRSIFSGKVTIQKDPHGRYWGDKMPQFMGHKTEMFDRTVQTLREKMSPQELANYDTVVDYFGGGGCWGMSLALATMPNVKRIIINEFDPARASKIELLQTIGEKIADEAEKVLMDDGVLDDVFAKMKTKGDDGGESGSGATLANLLLREYKPRYMGDKRKLGLLYAITDCASRQLAGSRDVRQPDGTTAKVKITIAERWQKVKDQLANDGKNASEMRKEIEKRGGTVEYVNGNSTLDDFGTGFKTPHGGNVMAVCDPPYYRTEGYSDDGSSWKVGLEKTAGGYAYADTAELMQRLVDNGDGIVYTDEAWWLKPEYLTTHNVESDGLFDNADLISSQREYRTEHGILQGIRNTLDHFDVAGRVAGRYETLGVQHGNDDKTTALAGIDNADGAEHGSKPDGSGSADNGRHSVRRLAGGTEGENGALLRGGRKGGQRSEDVVREVNAAIIDALPDGTYGFPGQLATLERIIRHSVRSVREDKQKAYAKTVAKNAKAYLARTAKQLDARMKAAGYTEKVWHGTGSGQFQVFRLSTREDGTNSIGGFADDGIKMAFFSYQERTAENYAALSAFDINTDYEELYPGAKPDVREYYINPGKCLELDEKKFPQSYREWTKTIHKAWKNGYDSIRVKGALDDQLFRLNADYSGIRMENRENLTPEEEYDVDAEGAIRTDILVVFDHGEKNPGANRIKAADPITFWDEEHGELPIPPEMRANKDFPDLRFSIQAMGKNAKEEASKAIEKYRPDLGQVQIESADQWREWKNEYETSTGNKAQDDDYYDYPEFEDFLFAKRKDWAIAEIEKFQSVKERKAALYWFCKATVRLPEDAQKITEALKTAERAKVDPMQFERPGDVLEQFAEYRPKEKPINPDTVPELSDRREMGHGIVTYLVQDDKAGQAAMRRIINTHFGKDASPWCLLQGDGDGNLTDDAWHYWNHYDALPKRVAFKNGKLVAFMATDRSKADDVDIEDLYAGRLGEEIEKEWAEYDGEDFARFMRERHPDRMNKAAEQWWDRTDASHDGIPFRTKDEEGRTLEQELMQNGEIRTTKISKGDPKADGIYEEWNFADDQKYHVVTERRNGVPYKTTHYWRNGNVSAEAFWPDRNKDDSEINRTFNEDGTLRTLKTHLPYGRHASISLHPNGMSLTWHEVDRAREEVLILPGDGITKEEISITKHYIDAGGRNRRMQYDFRDGILTELDYEGKNVPVTDFNRLYLPPLNAQDIADLIEASFKSGKHIAPLTQIASSKPQRASQEQTPPEMRGNASSSDVRFSINRAWANSAPMTAREIRRAVKEFGTTADPKLVAYITPDGEWLDYDEMGEHADIRWSYTQRHRDELDKELIDKGDATPYVAAAIKGGLVRVTGGIFTASGDPVELGIQFTGRPDAKKLDNIRAFFAAAAERYPAARLLVECVGPSDYSDWARQYAPGETGRIDRELREFAATGEPPAQVGPSLVAEFHERFSIRKDPPPKKTGIGYKVFFQKNGKLYPPMVANPNGADTPVGVWLDADAAPIVEQSKTGRNKVRAGGKGTQGGSGTLAYRPGWHLGKIPYALQFNRGEKVDNTLGIRNQKGELIKVGRYFPADFVWAEVEYAADKDYQDEAMKHGINPSGKFQHSLAGLPHLPKDGSYEYRTNANPATDPWIITGSMKVNRILTKQEVDAIVITAGRQPQEVEPRSSVQIQTERETPTDSVRFSVMAAGRYYGTRMRELAHGIKTGEKNAIAESARILADYVHDNAVLVPMPSHTGKATTMKSLAEAIAKIRPDVEVVDALKSDPHESNYTHKQRLHKPVAVTMHPTGAKIPEGRPVMVVDNVLASGTTARAALAVIPDADILVLGDASRAADPNEKLSKENETLRHSIIIGARKSKARKDPDRGVRLAEALDMFDTAGEYDDKTREEIYIQTGWWMGVDGKWRVEIPNIKPKQRFGKTMKYPESMGGGYTMINGLAKLIWKDGEERKYAPLKDMAIAPMLFDAYPQLKNINVVILDPDSDEMEGINGYYDGHTIGISWDCVQWKDDEPSNILNEQGVQTLTHEIQHIVQAAEGFAYGGNTEDYGPRNYPRLAGEVEARNAARRNTNFKMYGGFARLASTSADPDLRTWAVNNGNAPWQTEDVPQAKQIITYGDGKMTDINGKPVARHSVYRDVETDARRAISAIAQDGDKKEAQDALENYVAYFKLAHGPLPRPRTIARIGLSLGMNVVDPKRILKNADKLAERMRGTAIEKAAGNGDVGTAIAMIKREKDLDKRIESILAGGVSLGSQLTHKGVGQINALTQKRVERMMNDFTAATLADMEGDTGINLAAEILENNPDAFETEYRKAKKLTEEQEAETAEQQQAGSAPEAPASGDIDEEEMSDADRYKRQVMMKEAAERVAKFIEEAKKRAAENNAQAADRREKARQRLVESGDASAEGEGSAPEATASGNGRFDVKPPEVKAGFKTPEEFAAFLRVWTADKFAKTHGLTTIGQAQQNKLFAEYYRICARQELQDLADKLLAPKMLNAAGELVTNARVAKLGNGARAWVNRRLQEMEKGIRPDRIERMSADIFAFINKAAVRVSRVDLIANFKKDLKERFLNDPDFDEFKQDTERKVTGWVEEAARYICRVCDLSRISANGDPSQLEQEYRNLHEIIDRRAQVYDESGREVAAAAQEDAETLKAQWKLALLDKYGAMRSMMPGEILDLQNAAFQYLEEEAAKLEQAWKDTRAQQDQIRRDFTAAIVGPNGQKYQEKGLFSGRLFDALNGMIRLRLQHLTRFASPDEQAKAKNAINSLLVMLGDGETAYAKALQEDREAFFSGLGQIFQKPDGTADNAAIKKYLERMDQPIPQELSEKISNQGYVGTMTYGQLLQLLVSLEQRSFKDAIKANGREGQSELIRNFRYLKEDGTAANVVTAEDSRFIEMLRAFYAAKRDQLSAVTERMVGHKVDSPDPLYCPVRRWIDDKARTLHTDPTQRWDPISKIFSRRVESDRDFDESRTIIGLFFENSKESAKLTAWAERGSFIRNIVTSVGFQATVKRAFGNGELGKILKQLEATFNGGEVRSQTPGEVAAADKAVNFVTYAYLGFNPLSALKQTTSPFVWANVLDGGFADLWRHMTHFDKNVLKHLMESDEYKVRYGNKVGSGMDYATKGLNMNPSENPAMRFLTGAGMWMLKRGDFIPGGWIAQGVYKDMLNKHMNEGMDYETADKLAITETFNLLEETQQSGRTYNTNMLQIEHGRIGRLLTQFATSPLQQLQYETQAWREWRDMVRYQMGEKKIAAARQRFWRAAVINHVLMPAAMNFVIAAYKAAMGEEPPWEKDGYHWSLLIDVLMGQFSRVFFLGAFAQTTLNAIFKRETPRAGQILPIEGALGMVTTIGFTVHDMATLNYDNIQKDLERMLKSTAPTRIPFNVYRRITSDSDADRKAKKEAK